MHPTVTALALALAGGALVAQAPTAPAPSSAALAPAPTPARLAVAQALEPARAAQALAFARSLAPGLGLAASDGFQVVSTLTNPQGQAVTRFVQTHDGYPVQGTALVVRVGEITEATTTRVEASIALAGEPGLSAADALAIAHRDLPPTEAYPAEPTVERIVFPGRMRGGVHPRVDATSGAFRPDPLRSVSVGAVAAHVWAYHVTRPIVSAGQTISLHAIVDGSTGLLLDKWVDGLDTDPIGSGAVQVPARDYLGMIQRQQAPLALRVTPKAGPAPAAATSSIPYVPATGVANTVGLGPVLIPTAYDPVNVGYGLLDIQRGAGGGPFVAARGWRPGNRIITDEVSDQLIHPDRTVTTYFRDYTLESGPSNKGELTGSLNNLWGNGQDFTKGGSGYPSYYNDAAKAGAGEAMHAVTTTYDLFKNLFNRKSYDNADTSIIVKPNVYFMAGKAMWRMDQGFITTGWGDPVGWGWVNGTLPLRSGAELTNIAHELGVAMYQTGIPYTNAFTRERPSLERSMGALTAQLAQAYMQRQPGDPADVLPRVPVDWTFGRTRLDGRPLFWMDKPSRDGISRDAYFDGIWMLGSMYFDGTSYSDGPMNRAWYFLSEGASSNPAADSHSDFLPQGMDGIGLQKTAMIAYKAFTERYVDATGYDEARTACIAAAADLYGPDSPEVVATTNAFAAVNVGGAYGQPAPLRVSFPAGLTDPLGPLNGDFVTSHYTVVPLGEWTRLHVQVDHATDSGLDWKATGLPGIMTTGGYDSPIQGTFNAAGLYKAPEKGDGFWGVQAWSRQDPRQFAQGAVWALGIDGNGDGDTDALDFADFAMLCYLPAPVKDFLNPHALFGPQTEIGDPEMALVNLAFHNAFKP